MSLTKLSAEEVRMHKGISFTGITTVFFCHDGDGKLLLGKRSDNARDEHGRWDPGGGGVKHGQSIEDNLKRELKEEYDVIPKKIDFIGYFDAFRESSEGLPTHWLAMCFAVLVDPNDVKINEPDMIDEIGWFTLDDLPDPLHSQFKKFFSLYEARLKELMGI